MNVTNKNFFVNDKIYLFSISSCMNFFCIFINYPINSNFLPKTISAGDNTANNKISKKIFSTGRDPPIKARGIDPIK